MCSASIRCSKSGYVAAVLSRLARRVYSVDRFRTLVERTRAAVEHLGLSSRVEVRLGDGLMGWTEAAPFDRVLLMGAVTGLPEDIARQVGAGGIVVMPVMRDGQGLILRLQKQPDGGFGEQIIAKEAFPPLIPGVAREL